MKKYISLFMIISLCNIPTFAQWTQQYSNSNEFFRSVFFIDDNKGFAVGRESNFIGIIYGTTNGGIDWFNVPGQGNTLNSVCFSTPNIGFAVGSNGTIIKTTDGGNYWNNRTSGTDKSLIEVFFINADTGWIAGGYMPNGIILKTTDQGETWIEKQIPDSAGNLYDIQFIDQYNGWAVGRRQKPDLPHTEYEFILKTTDGGDTWISKPSGIYDLGLSTVYFKNETHGWVGGSRDHSDSAVETWAAILKTTNGGDSWISQISGVRGGISDINFCDDNIGWAAGAGNFKTTNGGNTWVNQDLTDIYINNMFFLNANTGWGTASFRIYKYQTSTAVRDMEPVPSEFILKQNYPNPFNPTTTISYSIPKTSFTKFIVYDLLGRELDVLVNEEKPPGNYYVDFNAGNLTSGIYFYRLQTDKFIDTKKMVLLK